MKASDSSRSSHFHTPAKAGLRGNALLVVLLVVIFFLCVTLVLIMKLPPLGRLDIVDRLSPSSISRVFSTSEEIDGEQPK